MIDFIRSDFFPIKEFIDLNSLTKTLDQNLVNLKISSNFIINDISSLNVVRNNSLVFISENKFYEKLLSKDICIISDNARILDSKYPNIMLVDDLSDSYNLIINSIYHHEDSFNYNDDFDFVNGSIVGGILWVVMLGMLYFNLSNPITIVFIASVVYSLIIFIQVRAVKNNY